MNNRLFLLQTAKGEKARSKYFRLYEYIKGKKVLKSEVESEFEVDIVVCKTKADIEVSRKEFI